MNISFNLNAFMQSVNTHFLTSNILIIKLDSKYSNNAFVSNCSTLCDVLINFLQHHQKNVQWRFVLWNQYLFEFHDAYFL